MDDYQERKRRYYDIVQRIHGAPGPVFTDELVYFYEKLEELEARIAKLEGSHEQDD